MTVGPASVVATRLSNLAPLGPVTLAALAALKEVRKATAGAFLIGEQEPLRPRFLVSGWAARVRWLADGRRQIISFVLPGDGIGLCERPQPLAIAPVIAITAVELVDAAPIARLAFEEGRRDLRDALLVAASMEEACILDQVVRLGRQSSLERIAHLFLELRDRLRLAGLIEDDTFALPITQEQIADAMGLTSVHVNRILQRLRSDGLVELRNGRLRLTRPELLEAIGDYRAPVVARWRPRSTQGAGA